MNFTNKELLIKKKILSDCFIGERFSRLTIISLSHNKNGTKYYLCLCDCGNTKIVSKYSLRYGSIRSCGCLKIETSRARLNDLTGRKFNRLTPVEYQRISGKAILWKCICDCGNITFLTGQAIKSGLVKSCGCYSHEVKSAIKIDLTDKRFGKLRVLKFSRKHNKRVLWLCKCDCGVIKEVRSDMLGKPVVSCGCFRIERVRESNCGEKNHNWRGGVSRRDYPTEWNESLRESVRERDNRKCQFPKCVNRETSKKLDVHHIDGNKKNCSQWNLISMCNRHHSFVENNSPKNWIPYFYSITGGIGG